MKRGYSYTIDCCDYDKSLGSADTFKTAAKALEQAKSDFKEFRNVPEAYIRIEDEDGKIVARYRKFGDGWIKQQGG